MDQKLRPDMDIGHNIGRLRKAAGYSQDDMIARLGAEYDLHLSQSTYSKLENNRMNIRVSELVAISQILDVPVQAFFEGLHIDKI